MEKGNQVFGSSSSSSSFTNDLFGPKEPSKTSLFGSVFGPHSTGLGRDSTHSVARGSSRIQDPGNQSCGNAKYETSDNRSQRSRGDNSTKNLTYQNEKIESPCHLSSSIYYGGQDVYYPPAQTTGSQHTFFSSDLISSRKMEKKMMIKMETIHTVLQEEIGGRDHCITDNYIRTKEIRELRQSSHARSGRS
ncbi:hypothetical protein RND71_028720 [Anisodus tanguticus]|uniref:Uncharacterized protein n=1 Tax=Anisodus tanguticus TaxID=243964 RepID=A0AAE1RLJ1_9SOLA|nr:hypothetical protein RND71_028720 [Anisodus tanguticus]